MAKRPIVHCRICKGDIDRDNSDNWTEIQKNWFYHIACYEDFAKKKNAAKKCDILLDAGEDFWKAAVCDYLTKDLKTSVNWAKFESQWKNFLKKGLTAKGIYFTLRYFYEVEKGDLQKGENGIGIVPYIYDRGTRYWGERNQRDKGICERIEEQVKQMREREIRVIKQTRKTKKKPIIDLKKIALEDDND